MPSTYDFQALFESIGAEPEKLEMHTSYMMEVKKPEVIAANLDALRKGTLRKKSFALELDGFVPRRDGSLYPQVEFDTLVATGLSGVLPLVSVANTLGVNWLAIRKPGENTHTGAIAEGTLGRKWLFLDDFIETGETYFRVLNTVTDRTKRQFSTDHVGIFQYHTGRDEYMAPNHHILVERKKYFDGANPDGWKGRSLTF